MINHLKCEKIQTSVVLIETTRKTEINLRKYQHVSKKYITNTMHIPDLQS